MKFNRKRKRKGRKSAVEHGMGGEFAGVAALSAVPDRLAASPIPLAADLEKYRRHVDHLDMPEEHKHELLQSLWLMMKSFVDRAFGEDSTQLARASAGNAAKDATADSSVVASSPDDHSNNFEDLSNAFRHHAVKREDGRKR